MEYRKLLLVCQSYWYECYRHECEYSEQRVIISSVQGKTNLSCTHARMTKKTPYEKKYWGSLICIYCYRITWVCTC